MNPRKSLGRASSDQRDLAACVRALTREASAAHAAASNDAVASVVEHDRPQLELNWNDHFSMRICSSVDLERALASLSAEQREAVVLRYADDLTYEEMARITGAGTSALKMRVQRAFVRLRILLGEVQHV